jgi:hypothetical protein
MDLKRIYMLVLVILSVIFAILVPLSLFVSVDLTTAVIVLLQEVLYVSLIWLSWREYKTKEEVELEIEKRKK